MSLALAVLVSGSGSNLQSIIDKVEAGALDADIRVVLSNKPDAYGLTRARTHGIPAVCLDHKRFDGREAFDAEMVRVIREHGADAVAMAGFMRMVTPVFLGAFPGRVVNIHPALLPSFPGVHGQADAAAYGVRFSGCTVHFVDEKMDHGPVIIQAVVPAYPEDDGDTLGARILAMEHRIYPQALQWLAEGRLRHAGRKVVVEGCGPCVALTGAGMVNPPLEPGF
ncbi:phosphoribosylglycinamide formyltransferase [Desulfovibrio sp. X2]|uniref:phosphoribosylglycinamide formyltransferase n=1 Tax=Desulfovibrio sp. X2 TaxID=941449 RepID=UPI0003588DD9|nr:phosphoribosylglycinamide formyltransferase [Desulfovibrio sp. X2]EPR43867.1 phosphoribosylglycinamide formyltransferase [Desulfovibrio sp. X2]